MTNTSTRTRSPASSTAAARARKKFLRFFPEGFRDQTYLAWERNYKWNAHLQWQQVLNKSLFKSLLADHHYAQIAAHAVRIEARTNLLFSFEKMALRDAVKSTPGAKLFATGLFDLLHGQSSLATRFTRWIDTLAALPRRQTRVLTWPLATVFAFLAQPETHFFLKPLVTRRALDLYGLDFHYQSHPNVDTYNQLLTTVDHVRKDLKDLHPKDMIDLQSFLWVQGSDEYD